MKIDLYNQNGEVIDKIELPDEVFDLKFNADLVKQVIEAQLANSRQVTAHTKGRGDVRGGGAKPWKQKGTGRARHGSRRSPIWKGGGVAFGPTKERNFARDINKKMKQKALFMTLSSKTHDGELAVLENMSLNQIKTKEAVNVMSSAPKWFNGYKNTKTKRDSILAVISDKDKNVEKSYGNLPFVSVIEARNLNSYDVLAHKYLLITRDSIPVIKKTFLKNL